MSPVSVANVLYLSVTVIKQVYLADKSAGAEVDHSCPVYGACVRI